MAIDAMDRTRLCDVNPMRCCCQRCPSARKRTSAAVVSVVILTYSTSSGAMTYSRLIIADGKNIDPGSPVIVSLKNVHCIDCIATPGELSCIALNILNSLSTGS